MRPFYDTRFTHYDPGWLTRSINQLPMIKVKADFTHDTIDLLYNENRLLSRMCNLRNSTHSHFTTVSLTLNSNGYNEKAEMSRVQIYASRDGELTATNLYFLPQLWYKVFRNVGMLRKGNKLLLRRDKDPLIRFRSRG